MALSEGYGYVVGNLSRDWETKEVSTKDGDKLLYTCGLAYQPNKDVEVVWVDLTIWPDPQGSVRDAVAVADATGKGTKVIVRGTLKQRSYVAKDGSDRKSWQMSCWQVAKVLRAPFEGASVGGGRALDDGPSQAPFDDTEPF